MSSYFAEFLGTCLVVLLGNGSVANVLLKKTKGQGADLIVILMGWSMAVFIGVYITAPYSGAHLNPIVTLCLATVGKFAWQKVPAYICAQMLGGLMGSFLVWLGYRDHYKVETNPDIKLATFCTAPAIRDIVQNTISEALCTFVLILGILYLAQPHIGLGSLDALPVGLLILGIGISLGGTTGYAMNPARDLSPRIMHALLPIPHKRDSDWGYALVPVIGPLIGGMLASGLYLYLH